MEGVAKNTRDWRKLCTSVRGTKNIEFGKRVRDCLRPTVHHRDGFYLVRTTHGPELTPTT